MVITVQQTAQMEQAGQMQLTEDTAAELLLREMVVQAS
jgi:hypothetical protein